MNSDVVIAYNSAMLMLLGVYFLRYVSILVFICYLIETFIITLLSVSILHVTVRTFSNYKIAN